MAWGMDLGEEIAVVVFAGPPEYAILSTLDSVSDPVVSHVDGLGSLQSDFVVCNVVCCGVVGDHRGGLLRVSKVCEGVASSDCSLTIDE